MCAWWAKKSKAGNKHHVSRHSSYGLAGSATPTIAPDIITIEGNIINLALLPINTKTKPYDNAIIIKPMPIARFRRQMEKSWIISKNSTVHATSLDKLF